MRLLTVIFFFPFMLMNKSVDTGPGAMVNAGQDQKPLFSFGIIADVQYADYEPAGTRFYRSSLNKLREAVSEFREDSVDFVITLGDLIDKDYDSFEPVLNILASSGLKFYHIAGNHDYSVDPGYKTRLPSAYTSKHGFYSVIHYNFRFIFLDGNDISTYSSTNKIKIKHANALLDSLKKSGEPNAVEWNGGISTGQLMWLDSQMNEATDKNEKVFLICHFPVVPEDVHNLLNYKEVLAVLGKYRNSVAWFNGHNHNGNYGNFNRTHFVTFKGMVETEQQNSFTRVDIYRNSISIVGSGREKSQILAY
jgi:manganese-dependent ADP-ribose/CDP-alcohol diphosphatase